MRITQIILLLICVNLGMAFTILIRLLLTDLEMQTFQATEEVMVDTSKRFAQQIEAKLATESLDEALCQSVFPDAGHEHEMDIKIYGLSKSKIGLNHYITDSQGLVIFDTQDQLTGKDFSQYNDVMRTLKGEYGARSSRMKDDDPDSSIFYVGAPIKYDGETVGVLSLYKEQSDVTPFVWARRRQILQVCILMGVGTGLFIVTVFFWVYRPIGKLTKYAQGVIDGKRPQFPKLGKGREINTLGTALKTMRETLEGRTYAKSYVQTLSHELKSPISAIKATAELLQEDMSEGHRERFLNSIISQVERSEKAITRLQQLSHVERMTELERKESVSLDVLFAELVKDYTSVARTKDVHLSLSSPPILFEGDPFLLRSVFQNLLDNAVKYSAGNEEVQIIALEAEKSIEVTFSNKGAEIPEYAQKRVFERLFSLGDTEAGKGSGIGLALVKEAVNLHGGSVSYAFESGRNTFRVFLPK